MVINIKDKKIILKGTVATKGKISGIVYLIKNPSKVASIKKGAIIVAPFTTPIMAATISNAAGLITEIGGITCHAAIISREFNIPCIVGVENATKILRSGQKIILDADKNIILWDEAKKIK